jgi:hypothetical protein
MRRGRPSLPPGLAGKVFALVESQVSAGKYPSTTAACAGLAELVGRPGGSLAKAGPMALWEIMACAGSRDFRSVEVWEALYREGRKAAGLGSKPAGRKRKS